MIHLHTILNLMIGHSNASCISFTDAFSDTLEILFGLFKSYCISGIHLVSMTCTDNYLSTSWLCQRPSRRPRTNARDSLQPFYLFISFISCLSSHTEPAGLGQTLIVSTLHDLIWPHAPHKEWSVLHTIHRTCDKACNLMLWLSIIKMPSREYSSSSSNRSGSFHSLSGVQQFEFITMRIWNMSVQQGLHRQLSQHLRLGSARGPHVDL